MEQFYRIIVSEEILSELEKLEKELGLELSQPQPLSNAGKALNAPIGGAEIMAAAQVVTAVFGAGTSIVIFLSKLLDLVKKTNSHLQLIDGRTGKTQILTPNTKIEDIKIGK